MEREYAVALGAPLAGEQARTLNAGIKLDEGLAKLAAPIRTATPDQVRELALTLDPRPERELVWYRAVLAQGWKRQLRRMFGAVDAPIVRLVRVRIGPLRLGQLPSGRARGLKSAGDRGPEGRSGCAAAGAIASIERAAPIRRRGCAQARGRLRRGWCAQSRGQLRTAQARRSGRAAPTDPSRR